MTVVVYTSSACPNCRSLKEKLKEKGIEFEERSTDIDEIRLQLYMDGRCTVPTLKVDGRVEDDIEGWLKK